MTHRRSSFMAPLECGCPSPAVGLLDERRRVLRFQRALQTVASGPQGRPRLAFALVKLLELDLLLVRLLARMHQGSDPSAYVVLVPKLLAIGADKRAKVLDALRNDERAHVTGAFARTRISAQEAMSDALAMPCEPAPPMLAGIPIPLRDADAEFLATTAWGTVLPWPCGG